MDAKNFLTLMRSEMPLKKILTPHNDLSYCLTDKLRKELSTVARDTLEAVEKNGWPHVFGDIANSQKASHKVTTLKAMAAVAPSQIQPWSCEG